MGIVSETVTGAGGAWFVGTQSLSSSLAIMRFNNENPKTKVTLKSC